MKFTKEITFMEKDSRTTRFPVTRIPATRYTLTALYESLLYAKVRNKRSSWHEMLVGAWIGEKRKVNIVLVGIPWPPPPLTSRCTDGVPPEISSETFVRLRRAVRAANYNRAPRCSCCNWKLGVSRPVSIGRVRQITLHVHADIAPVSETSGNETVSRDQRMRGPRCALLTVGEWARRRKREKRKREGEREKKRKRLTVKCATLSSPDRGACAID